MIPNGPFGNMFPYTNFHSMNLDWVIQVAKDFLDQYTNIQQTITDGLDALDAKKEALEALLQAWYDEHSQDIADQLADALADLNAWYTLHEDYLDATLVSNISAFDTHAEQKAEQTIASIPDDYTTLSNDVNDLEYAVRGITEQYSDAKPMTYSAYQDRIKIIDAFYSVKNGYIYRCVFLRILTDAITSANTWTLGNLSPDANLKSGTEYIEYTAQSISGGNVTGLTFKQKIDAPNLENNLEVTTTGAVSPGQGGIIMLTHKQAMNGPSNAIPDTVYPSKLITDTQESVNLFNSDFAVNGYAWRVSASQIQQFTDYSYIMIRVLGGSSIATKGLTENLTALGYAILDEEHHVLASGGESPIMIIDIPANGYWLVFSYPTSDNISLIPYFKKKVVVLGDSWADNDPLHTTYTKWPTLLQRDGRYSVKVYAKNGAWITGETPDYDVNGNVAGQMEQLKTDNIPNVDIVILMGGINDFRGNVAVNSIASKINEFYSTLNWLYPKARIIYIANNQVFFTQEQISYFHDIINYLRAINGIEAFTSFGWVLPNHYIEDNAHVDDYGYKDIYANIISIINGGQVVTCRVETQFTLYDSNSNNVGTAYIREEWKNEYPEYAAKINLYSTGLGKAIEKAIATSDNILLSSVPFAKALYKAGGQITYPISLMTCNVAESFETQHKLNTTNTVNFAMSTANAGIYYTGNYN